MKLTNRIFNKKDNTHKGILMGVITGLYPFLFYYANNFEAIFSTKHIAFFTLFFIGIPIIFFQLILMAVKYNSFLKKYQEEVFFMAIILCVSVLLSQAMFLTIKKKMLFVIGAVSFILAFKLAKQYNKLLVLIAVMMIHPLIKCCFHMYAHYNQNTWMQIDDSILSAKFLSTPNIYVIQPDGYVNKSQMETKPYAYKTDFYDWLKENEFTLYHDFRSNYPASLSSNSSLFAMQQHKFGNTYLNTLEVPMARKVICGDNPVLKILKANNYKTHFIVQDEYFQQGITSKSYDYYNIKSSEIPFFSNDNNVKKEVFKDFKKAMSESKTNQPKFFFIEKLLPHHIHFSGTIEEERHTYLSKIETVNIWLKKIINFIIKKDKNALIIVLADHGGWVGIDSWNTMYSTTDQTKIRSIYSSIAAIKWNRLPHQLYDTNLKTHVNLFRVLFSVLAKNKTYLNLLQDNSSYNLNTEGVFLKSKYKVINENGKIEFNKIEN